MLKRINFFLYLILFCSFVSVNAEFTYKSFDDSMYKSRAMDNGHYSFYKKIYEERNPSKIKALDKLLIPKKIHQIWLGPKKIPDKYQEYSKSWQKLHPKWEYKLWTESDIEKWDFPNKDLFDKASSYQEKADILRYEILLKHGGLYVDMDMKALQSFDHLHYYYVFYAGIESPYVTNAIIASAPNNIIFKDALKKIRSHWDVIEKDIKNYDKIVNVAVNRCMMPFSESIRDNLERLGRAIILPVTYLTVSYKERGFHKMIHFLGIDWIFKNHNPKRFVHKETMSYQLSGEAKEKKNLSSRNLTG